MMFCKRFFSTSHVCALYICYRKYNISVSLISPKHFQTHILNLYETLFIAVSIFGSWNV